MHPLAKQRHLLCTHVVAVKHIDEVLLHMSLMPLPSVSSSISSCEEAYCGPPVGNHWSYRLVPRYSLYHCSSLLSTSGPLVTNCVEGLRFVSMETIHTLDNNPEAHGAALRLLDGPHLRRGGRGSKYSKCLKIPQ